MVTFNLSSVDNYDENELFNVLNSSVNHGWLGIYRVSPAGFSITKIEPGQLFYSNINPLHEIPGIVLCHWK